MYIYTFTNDLRVEYIPEYLSAISKHIETGEWSHPSYSLEQALNGAYQTYEFYFGLKKGSANTALITQNKSILVIKEFVKKFQYPNPRNTKIKGIKEMIDNNQNLAPLRIAVKLLYRRAQNNGSLVATLTHDEFRKYILTNPDLVEGSENIGKLDQFIKENLSPTYSTDFELYGAANNYSRFINTLLGLVGLLPFLEYKSDRLTLDISDLNDEEKYILGDILTYEDFWEEGDYSKLDTNNIRDLADSYKEYMQAIPNYQIPDQPKIILGETDEETNIIYYGAPGTGKSFEVNQLIKKYYPNYDDILDTKDSEYVFRTTIHNDYSFYDFVGQIMPINDYLDKSKINYKFNPGIFTSALIKAYMHPDKKVFLILEEMSRGNITGIFGEVFQLLDRDSNTGISEYGITNKNLSKELLIQLILNNDKISDIHKHSLILSLSEEQVNNQFIKIPGNLFIIGTLNTSDQSVFPMDSAFKRRFSFRYISLDPVPTNKTAENNFTFLNGTIYENWVPFYQGINKFIQDNSDVAEDKFIGQFFIIGKLLEGNDYNNPKNIESIKYNTNQIKDKLLNYLFNDVERLIRITNSEVSLFSNKGTNYSQLYTDFSNEKNVFSQELLNAVALFNSEDDSE